MSVLDTGDGISHIRMRTLGVRLLGMEVSAFLVGDILIDTGFAYIREPLLKALEGRDVRCVCCTHNHEDHTGNAAAIQALHACPVYLRHADTLWDEGVRSLAPYRRGWWGWVDPFEPEEMPEIIESNGRTLRVVPTPGHSATQVAFFEEATGVVFAGDLFISPGAAALLPWGNPWLEVDSLRRIAALRPKRMLTGHGRDVKDPAAVLELKADRIEKAARKSVALRADGVAEREIVRAAFSKGRIKDRFFEWMTSREFSRLNFVRAAVRHAPEGREA